MQIRALVHGIFPGTFFGKISYHKVLKYTRVIFLAILSGSIARLTGVIMDVHGNNFSLQCYKSYTDQRTVTTMAWSKMEYCSTNYYLF